jgi:hypothetical protein
VSEPLIVWDSPLPPGWRIAPPPSECTVLDPDGIEWAPAKPPTGLVIGGITLLRGTGDLVLVKDTGEELPVVTFFNQAGELKFTIKRVGDFFMIRFHATTN